MNGQKTRLDPKEFHKLPYNKKLDLVTKMYIALCTDQELIVNKKLNKAYFMLRKHFFKDSPEILQVLYDWLFTLNTKEKISLTQAYQRAELHKDTVRMNIGKPSQSMEGYKPLMDFLSDL